MTTRSPGNHPAFSQPSSSLFTAVLRARRERRANLGGVVSAGWLVPDRLRYGRPVGPRTHRPTLRPPPGAV